MPRKKVTKADEPQTTHHTNTKLKTLPGVTEGELPASPQSKLAQQAANVRWALFKALPVEIEDRFRGIPIAEALEDLSKMRNCCEVAAKVINQRMTEETNLTKCTTCNGTKKGRDWRMVKPVRVPGSLTLQNLYFCSDVCIVLYNQKTQGVAAISDRGMSRGSAMPGVVNAQTAKAGK